MTHFTVATWNIHHGAGMDRRIDLGRIAGALHDGGVEVAGLQEVEVGAPRSRLMHQPRNLGKRLQMHPVFGASFRFPLAGEFGNALLSRYPVRHWSVYAMPSGKEPRTVLETRLETPAGLVGVFCTHWGLDDNERPRQARECLRRLEDFGGAALLLGDFNEGPDGPAVSLLRQAGLVLLGPDECTFPADGPTETIDQIWGTPGWKARDVCVMPVLASDHRPVIVEVSHP